MSGDLLGNLLRQVSRSFYLSLTVLPGPLREPIGLAYLLARAADTIADTELVARKDRLGHLETVRRACGGASARWRARARHIRRVRRSGNCSSACPRRSPASRP
jgi:phytoene/squalene synthetase